MNLKQTQKKVENAWPHHIEWEFISISHLNSDYVLIRLDKLERKIDNNLYGKGNFELFKIKNKKTDEFFISRLDGGDEKKNGKRALITIDTDFYNSQKSKPYKHFKGHHSKLCSNEGEKRVFEVELFNKKDEKVFSGEIQINSLEMDKKNEDKIGLTDSINVILKHNNKIIFEGSPHKRNEFLKK